MDGTDRPTDPALVPVLAALLAREPLFHRRACVADREDFERETAPDFWEVGASGRCYGREYVWSVLEQRLAERTAPGADDAEPVDWDVRDARVRQVAADVFLLTYTLGETEGRITRRLTVWRGSVAGGWMALFHQGTVVTG